MHPNPSTSPGTTSCPPSFRPSHSRPSPPASSSPPSPADPPCSSPAPPSPPSQPSSSQPPPPSSPSQASTSRGQPAPRPSCPPRAVSGIAPLPAAPVALHARGATAGTAASTLRLWAVPRRLKRRRRPRRPGRERRRRGWGLRGGLLRRLRLRILPLMMGGRLERRVWPFDALWRPLCELWPLLCAVHAFRGLVGLVYLRRRNLLLLLTNLLLRRTILRLWCHGAPVV